MRARILLAACLILTVTALTAIAFAPAPLPPRSVPPRLSCEAASADVVTASADARQAVIVIARKFGIGSATVTLESGEWPRRVRVVFRGFSNLESLELRHGDLELHACLANSPMVFVARKQKGGGFRYSSKPEKAFEVPVTLHGHDRETWLITADLPPAFLTKEDRTLNLSWLDVYRR
jgi:hypothetical protein